MTTTAPTIGQDNTMTQTAAAVLPTVHDGGTVQAVGPELARRWLETNNRNRKLRRTQVNAYASDMAAGRWHFTGEAIKFDHDGNLIDGQHRLAAIVAADVFLPMLVISGLDPESQHVMDTNLRRTSADAFALTGHKNTSILAAAAKILVLWDTGRVTLSGRAAAVSTAQQIEFVDNNPALDRAAELAVTVGGRIDCPQSVIAAAWFRLAQIDIEQANAFFWDLANLATHGDGDPRTALIHRLQSARRNRERVPAAAYLSMLIRTWNSVRDGRTMNRLQVLSRNGVIEVPDPR